LACWVQILGLCFGIWGAGLRGWDFGCRARTRSWQPEAHRLLYHSTLVLIVKKKREILLRPRPLAMSSQLVQGAYPLMAARLAMAPTSHPSRPPPPPTCSVICTVRASHLLLRGQKMPSPRPWKMIRYFHSTVRNPS